MFRTLAITALLSILYTTISTAQCTFDGGSGTAEEPFLIATAEQLACLKNYTGEEHRGKHFKITSDISLNNAPFDTGWVPVGYHTKATDYSAFEGVLDGNGKTISHLKVKKDAPSCTGLFGYCKGILRNIHLDSVQINGRAFTGALCGMTDSCEITGCTLRNSVIRGTERTGGLVGYAIWSRLSECSAACSVLALTGEGGGMVGRGDTSSFEACACSTVVRANEGNGGGLFGWSFVSTSYRCSVYADVTAGNYCGGFAGWSESGWIDSCEARVNIVGKEVCGGLVGFNNAPFRRCNVAGTVKGNQYVGGLAGHNADSATSSHFSGSVIGIQETGGACGFNSGKTRFCSAEGTVTGQRNTGGFAGHSNMDISDCFASAMVIGDSATGGFIGRSEDTIARCYASGEVSGRHQTGGFVGDGPLGRFLFCFATGSVKGSDFTGGFAGLCTENIFNSYAMGDVDSKGQNTGGFTGSISWSRRNISYCYTLSRMLQPPTTPCTESTPCTSSYYLENSWFSCNQKSGKMLTTAEFAKQSSFPGWDFDSIWTIQEGVTCPYLRWQKEPLPQHFLGTTAFDIDVAHDRNNVVHGTLYSAFVGNHVQLKNGSFQVTLHTLAGQKIAAVNGVGPATIPLSTLTNLRNQIVLITITQGNDVVSDKRFIGRCR